MPRIPSLRALLTLTLLGVMLPMAAGCARGNWVELAGQRYIVEIADDDEERARGLMFRDTLEEGQGMLFIHDRAEPRWFWMKNTKVPLDILYFDDSLRLVSQQRNVPPCSAGDRCPPYPSGVPARFVLELNAGEADRLELQDGEALQLGPDIQIAPQARSTQALARKGQAEQS